MSDRITIIRIIGSLLSNEIDTCKQIFHFGK